MRARCGRYYDAIRRPRGFLKRLARDTRGNSFIITGAIFLPLLALLGSGVDMARAYTAQARLQQACDAASLAGRRVMSNATVDASVRSEATKFFNFNFPQGLYNTASFTPAVTQGDDSTVIVTAATTIPTSIMKMFGFATLPLNVTCNAKQEFVNTDIVLVLDTTGSMKDKATASDSDTKIVALRKAVLSLYDQLKPVQDKLQSAGLRLRYGIVPYASSINVGRAIMTDANGAYIHRDYIVGSTAGETYTYQSRQLMTSTTIAQSTCTGNTYRGSYNSVTKVCSYFKYSARDYDVSGFVKTGVGGNGAAVDISPLIGTADSSGDTPTTTVTKNSVWNGCIEERKTVTSITGTSTSIPSGAYDLDIDMIPSSGNNDTRWKPYWSDVEYTPTASNIYTSNPADPFKPQYACPTEAKRLTAWARSDLSNYLDTLNPDGGTYHDNGMMWGARWVSPNGIFGADNPSTYAGMPVSRYIIFMTDGLLDTGYSTLYTTYGVEQYDGRVTGGGNGSNETDQASRHQQRFNLLCARAKNMGISIWIVAFASALDTNLTNCASNSAQASTSANSAALNAKFVEIGKNIGSLRLTK